MRPPKAPITGYQPCQPNWSDAHFDDQSIQVAQDAEVADLIACLLQNTRRLEEEIVWLRTDVNAMTPEWKDPPFPDIHSDLYQLFDDHPAYMRHRHEIEEFLAFANEEL